MRYFILDASGNPVAAECLEWAQWFEAADNRLALDQVSGAVISTVFLGLDHRHFGSGPPILWETMIFGGPHNDYPRRYISREEALAGHAEAVRLATEETPCTS